MTLTALAIASFTLAPDSVISMTEYLDISPGWLEQIPMGGASGPVAARRAARAVQAGDADIVACIGADTASADTFVNLVKISACFPQMPSIPIAPVDPIPFSP